MTDDDALHARKISSDAFDGVFGCRVEGAVCVLGTERLRKIRQVRVGHPLFVETRTICDDDGSPLSGEILVGCHLAICNAEIALIVCHANYILISCNAPTSSIALVSHILSVKEAYRRRPLE